MGRKQMGPVGFYLYEDAKGTQGDKPPLRREFGPFACWKEAEMKRIEEEEAVGELGYEYEYRIEPKPLPPIPKPEC